ncbi:MAG TPA: hypothetical protein VGL21_00890 [Jatrophihabitantaceae bacterium]|jgi:hypothetical protein
MIVLVYGLLCVGPAVIVWLVVKGFGWCANWAGPRRQAAPAASTRSLQRLVDDLRRIEREYLRVEASDLPARAARLRAINLAYDDTLRACCHELGLPEPGERPLSGVVRLQTEAELSQHGLVW